jgi:SAM-dependent methyltransferase
MGRKIPEANVQQAFVLDTVYGIISKIESPKILCVGSFEDTASEFLKVLGFDVEEVDPMLNYDLETFATKPTTIKGSYDAIFSTSVIEHVERDDEFLMLISDLLKPAGIAVLTCDYCDTYKTGDPKPSVDYRFYTQKDIKERLLPGLVDCSLVDKPQWDCSNPDFYYAGLNYTFATIVLNKHSSKEID